MITVKQRKGESATQLFYRFTRRFKRAGVTTELFKRRRHTRAINKNQRRKAKLDLIKRDEERAAQGHQFGRRR